MITVKMNIIRLILVGIDTFLLSWVVFFNGFDLVINLIAILVYFRVIALTISNFFMEKAINELNYYNLIGHKFNE